MEDPVQAAEMIKNSSSHCLSSSDIPSETPSRTLDFSRVHFTIDSPDTSKDSGHPVDDLNSTQASIISSTEDDTGPNQTLKNCALSSFEHTKKGIDTNLKMDIFS